MQHNSEFVNITLEKKQEVDKNETKVTTKIVC